MKSKLSDNGEQPQTLDGGELIRSPPNEINDLADPPAPYPRPYLQTKSPSNWRQKRDRWEEHSPDYWAGQRSGDDKFQAALRAAGVSEGVNKTKSDGVGVRFIPRRDDLLKTSFE